MVDLFSTYLIYTVKHTNFLVHAKIDLLPCRQGLKLRTAAAGMKIIFSRS